MKTQTLFAQVFLISLFACNDPQAETEIKNTIQSVYQKANVYEQLGADTTLLSKQLSGLIAKAKEVEKLDRIRVLKSEYPTDKPLLIEGEIFTSIYEGYSSFEVNEMVQNGKTAKAVVRFKNEEYHLTWPDTMLLIQENGWKLDDVRYGNSNGSLQKNLKDFISSYKE